MTERGGGGRAPHSLKAALDPLSGIGCSRSCRPVATLGASFACSTRTTGGADAPATRRFCSRPPVRGQAPTLAQTP